MVLVRAIAEVIGKGAWLVGCVDRNLKEFKVASFDRGISTIKERFIVIQSAVLGIAYLVEFYVRWPVIHASIFKLYFE